MPLTKLERISQELYLNSIKRNLAFKRKLFKELFLHFVGIRPINPGNVVLSNYGAMYLERRRSFNEEEIHPENRALLSRRYIDDPAKLEEVRQRSEEVITDEIINDIMGKGTPRTAVTSVVADVIKAHHVEISSVANIGAFVDNQCAYLASRFPNVRFTSIDVFADTAALNQFFPQQPNWKFMSGYPLDALRNGSLKADLFFMTSTSVNFTFKELDKYIAAMAKSAKWIVFNEQWYPSALSLNVFRLPRPENINPRRPYLGINYLNYHNNYIYYLQKYGFRIVSSRIVPAPRSSVQYILQIVAERAV